MHIVHISAYFAPAYGFGGPPRSLLALCRAQRQAGLSLEVFTTTANPGAPLPAHLDGVDLDGIRVRYFPLSAPAFLLGAASMARPLALAMRDAQLVHVHGLFNRTVWMGAAGARVAGVPYVVSPRGMLEPSALRHHAWRKRVSWMLFDRQVLKHAACWHASSRGEADTLRRRAMGQTVVEIPNNVDRASADDAARVEARAFAGVPAPAPYVLFLGRVHPLKRLDLLATAWQILGERGGQAHLVIAGPDQAGHRATVEPLFRPSADRVHFCGPVDGTRKAGLVSGASALVLCSDSESFGMCVAEALAAGTPAVVTRTCPWPALEAARCGYWVDQSAPAIADGLSRLLDDPVEALAMGRRGLELVARDYDAASVGARWTALYRDLAGPGRAPVAAPA